MYDSMLYQAITAQTGFESILPWVAVITVGYFAYQVFFAKNKKLVDFFTTNQIVPVAIILLLLALAPATTWAVFGGAQDIALMLTKFFSVLFLSSIVFIALPAYLIKVVKPDYFGI